jgi:ferrous iron transport protein B
MELPEYKVPSLKFAAGSMLERGKAYIKKAGTIILVCNTVVQIMQSFTPAFKAIEDGAEDTSILATIAGPIAVLIVPIVGFKAWQLAAAAVTGFIAKENVVGTLATVYAVTNFIDTDELELTGGASEVASIFALTKVAALAYLMFNLYSPPCFAALGAMRSELQSKKWFWGAVGLQIGTGYTVGYLVFQIGSLIVGDGLQKGFVGGLIFVLCFAAVVIGIIIKNNRKLDTEYQLG